MATTARKQNVPEPMMMLIEDHRKVQKMFKQFEKLKEQDDGESKRDLVEQACAELKVHTQIEEEIFYPAARQALEETDLVAEALVEHDSAKQLIAKLEGGDAQAEEYDAMFTVLGEYVNHHITEEQDELFPKLKKADIDWEALGAQMQERKQQLQEELGLLSPEEDEATEEQETQSARRPRRETTSTRSRRAAGK
jgi:hemerythrin-like domain-containing protein